jgi:hypothetical protein
VDDAVDVGRQRHVISLCASLVICTSPASMRSASVAEAQDFDLFVPQAQR